jgi:hypothetical protein
MKLRTWVVAALAACLVASTAHAKSQEAIAPPAGQQMAQPMPGAGQNMGQQPHMGEQGPMGQMDMGPLDQEQSELQSYGSCESCLNDPSGSYDGGYGGLVGMMTGGRRLMFVGGAQYIYAQATFSDATAFLEQNIVTGQEIIHQVDFGYSSSYALYGGFYLPDCGGALLFNYTRLTSNGDYAADRIPGTTNIFGPFEINNNIRGHATVGLNSYGINFAKTIPLGCLCGCKDCGDSCDDCCTGCDANGCSNGGCAGGWCPAWDITWYGGVRFATVNWDNTISATQASPQFPESARSTLNFNGFGGHMGLLGRRYLGKRGLFSVYGRGDFSVLFGNVDIERVTSNIAGVTTLTTSNDITVPVTEIELGASAHLGARATVSGGYFWAAWHDLGMSPTYSFQNNIEFSHFDDANILGWNGLFGRLEVAF